MSEKKKGASASKATENKELTSEVLPPPAESVSKISAVEIGSSLSIHRRMLLVYEWVTHVMKNDTVEMAAERSYKAVTHDDISAALHLPLARAGILYEPYQDELTITEFETKKPGWNNGPEKITKWYRCDVKVRVKFVNADKPDEFLEYKGAAFAIDSSDKGPAKAMSLALKVIDLKAFKLESRDGEESREFEKRTDWDDRGQNHQNRQNNQQSRPQNQNRPQQNQPPRQAPPMPPKPEDEKQEFPPDETENQQPPKEQSTEFVMPIGGDDVKGKPLSKLSEGKLKEIYTYCQTELKKSPPPKNLGVLFDIQFKVKAFLNSVGVEV